MEDFLTQLFPIQPDEDTVAWTTRVLSHAKEYGTYRQCSIGWHEECSQRGTYDGECGCLCHDPANKWYSVEGHAEGGTITVLRVEEGKQNWPAQPGEPATMWAHWIMASSAAEAEQRAVARENIIP